MFDVFFSHPNKLYTEHISNMFDTNDTTLEREVKRFHDIAKLKDNFQRYIRGEEGVDKNHSLLSAYIFLQNSDFDIRDRLFGFLAIASHHSNVENFFKLNEDNRYIGRYCTQSKELDFWDEVVTSAKTLPLYQELKGDIARLEEEVKVYQKYIRSYKFKNSFDYKDFIDFKKLYASLIYADKFEAIFGISKERKNDIDLSVLTKYIDELPFHKKRDDFRKFVLSNFDKSHRLFTLTAPTGYGKTLTALEFATKFKKEKIIFALPFTSIIDQTEEIVRDIFKNNDIDIFKIHHKTTIDESVDKDRYSQVKFLMSSFSGDINITTLYQIIFALFGNKNRDNVKFNQFRDAVIIIDEAQAIPYIFRQDFFKICELISNQLDTVFIFMSATMPVMSDGFKEISNLDYFSEQNRYVLKWLHLEDGQESLMQKVKQEAKSKHTLCVVNTIKKAQELYQTFRDDFECYCLNGYMTDHDKQRVVEIVRTRLSQDDVKILLISTQSIEAGIDLDFEVGFREVSPISSIIQTAGRVNRHFGVNQGTLYIFDDICKYSSLIYGDLHQISQAIFELLQNRDVKESNILEISHLYFEKIKNQLESLYLEKEMEQLAFFDIHSKIEAVMENGDYKELVIVEPYDGFIKEIETELFNIRKREEDKFRQKDLVQAEVKKLLQYGVNVNKKDIEKFATTIAMIKSLSNICYLPYGTPDYSKKYGIKKCEVEDVFTF